MICSKLGSSRVVNQKHHGQGSGTHNYSYVYGNLPPVAIDMCGEEISYTATGYGKASLRRVKLKVLCKKFTLTF